jgi:hypothetical protein
MLALGIVVFIMLLISGVLSFAFGQVEFTEEELLKLAEHNTERLYLKSIVEIQDQENDSLNLIVNSLRDALMVSESSNEDLVIALDYAYEIDSIQNIQIHQLSDRNKLLNDEVVSQNKRLNFWRIFTPITVTLTAIAGLFF